MQLMEEVTPRCLGEGHADLRADLLQVIDKAVVVEGGVVYQRVLLGYQLARDGMAFRLVQGVASFLKVLVGIQQR